MQAIVAQQVETAASYRIRMRNVGEVRPGDRLQLVASGRVFELVGVFRVDERSYYLDISPYELIKP